jgi:hypothetical protein
MPANRISARVVADGPATLCELATRVVFVAVLDDDAWQIPLTTRERL